MAMMCCSLRKNAFTPEDEFVLGVETSTIFVSWWSQAVSGLAGSAAVQSLFCPLEWALASESALVAASLGLIGLPLPVAQSALLQSFLPHPWVS